MVSVHITSKNLHGRHFVVGRPKSFKRLPYISFDKDLQNVVLPSLLLFSYACYYLELDDIHWTKVATLTAHNFNSSWLLYLHFSNKINLYSNIWFIRNSKCQQLLFSRKSLQKTEIVHYFKGPIFDVNISVF